MYTTIELRKIIYTANIEYPMDLETLIVEQVKLGKVDEAKEAACEFISGY